mgnify:CR=1 FL=1
MRDVGVSDLSSIVKPKLPNEHAVDSEDEKFFDEVRRFAIYYLIRRISRKMLSFSDFREIFTFSFD